LELLFVGSTPALPTKRNKMKKVLSIGLLGFVLFSCKPQTEVTEEETTSPLTTYLDSIEEVPQEAVTAKEVRYWSASETKLPQGVVYTMDCANRGTAEQKLKDNYVTIKRTNGFLTIVKDIDEDLFLNLQDGDIID
jgi:hypothetical protein